MTGSRRVFNKGGAIVLCSIVLSMLGLVLLVAGVASSFVLRPADMPGGLVLFIVMISVLPLAIYSYISPHRAAKLIMISTAIAYACLFVTPSQYTDISTHALVTALLLAPQFLVSWLLERLSSGRMLPRARGESGRSDGSVE